MTAIGINGFGRIGRAVLRAQSPDLRIVAVNDLANPQTLAHLLQYDSVHGRFPSPVTVRETAIVVDGVEIAVTSEEDPANIPWRKLGVDIVLECTGHFRERAAAAKHLEAGARKVIVSAPAKKPDITLCCGVNLDKYDPAKHHVISNASCTTNCLAVVAKVLDDSFGIVGAHMTTVHSYTKDQNLLDAPHKDLRRARAAALSMIPTTTGATRAMAEVLPKLAGRFEGIAIRVPTPNVSLVDVTAQLARNATAADLNAAFSAAAAGALRGLLDVTDQPLVSADFNGDKHSAIVDLTYTAVLNGNLAKVLAWYDNEIGYAQRLVDLARYVARAAS